VENLRELIVFHQGHTGFVRVGGNVQFLVHCFSGDCRSFWKAVVTGREEGGRTGELVRCPAGARMCSPLCPAGSIDSATIWESRSPKRLRRCWVCDRSLSVKSYGRGRYPPHNCAYSILSGDSRRSGFALVIVRASRILSAFSSASTQFEEATAGSGPFQLIYIRRGLSAAGFLTAPRENPPGSYSFFSSRTGAFARSSQCLSPET